jgi:hypothetical protein
VNTRVALASGERLNKTDTRAQSAGVGILRFPALSCAFLQKAGAVESVSNWHFINYGNGRVKGRRMGGGIADLPYSCHFGSH